ncbi:MAG TPA: DUF4286 family protein [Bacteroidia bacterium]|jgi:hypothetical protein|nr:DUF4286 family protein [Bacteroidia bacterium]
MYIYNVTINIDAIAHDEWLKWMREVHIPDVMSTGCFVDSRMLKILNVEDEGTTYSVQYTFLNMSDIEEYKAKHGPRLQKDALDKFKDKFVAFRTLLEIV